MAGVARGGRRSTPGTRARRAGTRWRTCCSATSTRPGACRSRSTGRPPICRRSPTTRCAGAPTATSTGEPLYGFGYGLSYTTFRYTQIGAVAGAYAAAAVEVENAGSRPGDEVVQVYVIPRAAPAYAPRRWLAGFQRVSLKPGERRIVKIPFGPNTLTYIDEAGARRPLDGQVDIAVGGRQPDRSGHYASDTQGATTTLALGLKN